MPAESTTRTTWTFALALAIAPVPATTADDRLPATIAGLDGRDVPLRAPEGGALAIVFLWTECPISNQSSPALNDLAGRFGPDRLRLVGLFVDADTPEAVVARHAEDYRLAFPAARLPSTALPRALGIETVPEAVVLDDRGTIRYRGRINDHFYAIGRRRQAVRSHDLRDAIAAVIAGEPVETPRTEAVGCTLPEFDGPSP